MKALAFHACRGTIVRNYINNTKNLLTARPNTDIVIEIGNFLSNSIQNNLFVIWVIQMVVILIRQTYSIDIHAIFFVGLCRRKEVMLANCLIFTYIQTLN
jgi:hypothetical protein